MIVEHYFVELIGFLLFTKVLKFCGGPLGPHFLVQLPRTQTLLGRLFETYPTSEQRRHLMEQCVTACFGHYFVELIEFLLFTEVHKCCGGPLGPHFLVQLPRTQKLLGRLFEHILHQSKEGT